MNNIKRSIAAAAGAISTLAYVVPAYAQSLDPCANAGAFARLCKLNSANLGGIVSAFITFLLIIAVLVSLFYLVYGGIRWVTSGGDKAKVENARNHIIAAIIGLVIAFLAFFILSLILGIFGLSLNKLTLPTIPTL
jgi:hypothetical protein